ANALVTTSPAWIIPGPSFERSTKGFAARRRTFPSFTYGFSSGLMSIAQPYECWESDPGFPVAGRQLYDEVRSRVLYQSFRRGGRYRGGSPMRWIRKPARYSRWKTHRTSPATRSFSTSGPVSTPPVNVWYRTRTTRRSSIGTGQPGCQF